MIPVCWAVGTFSAASAHHLIQRFLICTFLFSCLRHWLWFNDSIFTCFVIFAGYSWTEPSVTQHDNDRNTQTVLYWCSIYSPAGISWAEVKAASTQLTQIWSRWVGQLCEHCQAHKQIGACRSRLILGYLYSDYLTVLEDRFTASLIN